MDPQPKYSQYNEHSILIEWPPIIDENTLNSVLIFKNNILNHYTKLKVEVIYTYCSILVIYDFTIDNINDRFIELKSIFNTKGSVLNFESKVWEIPVCYDKEFGSDIEAYCRQKHITESEMIALHTSSIYKVYFIGFLPGFLYLGGLDSRLHLDRKNTPDLNVKKGSVAIGGKQTGIYPQDSPGGWHVIGKTPVELFNPSGQPPCLIQPGDAVKFVAIDKHTFVDIENQISDSKFQLKTIPTDA